MDLPDADGLDLRVVGLVSGGHFVSHFYLLAFPPLFPILAEELTLSGFELGLIMSAIQAGTFLQVATGDLVDRVGGKRVFVGGLVVTALGIGLAGVGGTYPYLLGFALVSSVGQSAFHPADYALLDAASTGSTEGRSYGLHNFAGSLGFAAGPAVVGGIALLTHWRVALVAAASLGLGYAVLAYLLMDDVHLAQIEDDDGAEDGGRLDLLDPTLLALFAFFVAVSFAGIGIQSFTTVLVDAGYGFSAAVGNTTLIAFLTLSAFGVLVGGWLADRLRPRVVIVPVLTVTGLLVLAVAGGLVPATPAALVVVFAVIGAVFGLFIPARDRLVNAASEQGSIGRSFGFVFTGISLAGVAGPAILGAVIDAMDVWAAFWIVGGGLLVAAAIAVTVTAGR